LRKLLYIYYATHEQPPTFDKDPISCHDIAPIYPVVSIIQPPPMLTQYEYHKLPYKYPHYYYYEIFLVICELIDKLSRSLGGDHDGVDCLIGNRLNKVIAGVNKESKATCN